MKKSKMGNLEKYLPKIKEGYYANKEEPEFAAKDRQDRDVVIKLLEDENAYNEFLTNILIYITGVVKLDRMNRTDDAKRDRYESVVTVSDEAYGLLLLEDKSVLWREVLNRRREKGGDGTISMGVKKEITIGDVYGDKYTLYSNGGVFSPEDKKGWSEVGCERYNYLYEEVSKFRAKAEGKTAMESQKKHWNKSPLFPNKKRRSEEEVKVIGTVAPKVKIRCRREAWV